jgi:hypothetical protein
VENGKWKMDNVRTPVAAARFVRKRALDLGLWTMDIGLWTRSVSQRRSLRSRAMPHRNLSINGVYEFCNTMWRIFSKNRGTEAKNAATTIKTMCCVSQAVLGQRGTLEELRMDNVRTRRGSEGTVWADSADISILFAVIRPIRIQLCRFTLL